MTRVLVAAVLACGCFSLPDRHPTTSSDGGDPRTDGMPGTDGMGSGSGSANIMFVSSTSFTLNMVHTPTQRVMDAESHCQTAAFQSLPGSPVRNHYYKAWMSADGLNAADILRATSARAWRNTAGEPIAQTVTDLTSGTLLSAPRYDENGQAVGASAQVMTGTTAAGINDVGFDTGCSMGIEIGDPKATDSHWTQYGYLSCQTTTMLVYCLGYDVTGSL